MSANFDRLRRLQQIMADVRDNEKLFNLGTYINGVIRDDANGTPVYVYNLEWNSSGTVGVDTDEACGTTCCALGYAALDPEFQSEGLELFAFHNSGESSTLVNSIKHFNELIKGKGQTTVEWFFQPQFDGSLAFNAGSEFFGISCEASEYLFSPNSYEDVNIPVRNAETPITPDDVIEHIQFIIDHYGLCPADIEDRKREEEEAEEQEEEFA